MNSLFQWTLALALVTPIFSTANTLDIELRCTAFSFEECEQKTQLELESLNCLPLADTIRCRDADESDPGMFYCTARTEKCTGLAPKYIYQESKCEIGEKQRLQSGYLFANWNRSLLRIWVRDICVIP